MPRSWVLIIGAVVLPGVLVLAGSEGNQNMINVGLGQTGIRG